MNHKKLIGKLIIYSHSRMQFPESNYDFSRCLSSMTKSKKRVCYSCDESNPINTKSIVLSRGFDESAKRKDTSRRFAEAQGTRKREGHVAEVRQLEENGEPNQIEQNGSKS